MVVMTNTYIAVTAMPGMSRNNHHAFGAFSPFIFRQMSSWLGDYTGIAYGNQQVRQWMTGTNKKCSQSEVNIFCGREDQFDKEVAGRAESEKSRNET